MRSNLLTSSDREGQLQRADPEHPAPPRLQRILLQGPREVRLRRLTDRGRLYSVFNTLISNNALFSHLINII